MCDYSKNRLDFANFGSDAAHATLALRLQLTFGGGLRSLSASCVENVLAFNKVVDSLAQRLITKCISSSL